MADPDKGSVDIIAPVVTAGTMPILGKKDRAMFFALEQEAYELGQEQKRVQKEIQKGVAKQKSEAAKRSEAKQRMRAGRLTRDWSSLRSQKRLTKENRMREEKHVKGYVKHLETAEPASQKLIDQGLEYTQEERAAEASKERKYLDQRKAFLKDIKHHKKMLADGDITKEQFNARIQNMFQEGDKPLKADLVAVRRIGPIQHERKYSRGVPDELAKKKPGQVLTKAEKKKADKLNKLR